MEDESFSGKCPTCGQPFLLGAFRKSCEEQACLLREIARLRAWLEWISVDDEDAQEALAGKPARTTE